MSKFNVGDEVVIINDANYGITTCGSVGIVMESEFKGEIHVQFKTIGKDRRRTNEQFFIAVKDLDFNVKLTPQERVIKKIKEMEERRKPHDQQLSPAL